MAEVEIKYIVSDPGLFARLEDVKAIGEFRVESRQSIEQTDEYWDTPDSAAAASAISIRRRSANGKSLHTVKVGAVAEGFSRRVEIEEPAGEAGLIPWLQGLLDEGRLELPFSPTALAPKLRVHNHRAALHLVHPDGAEIELALDRVTFEGPRGHVTELEIEGELLSGDESALHALRDWLAPQPGLTASHASKYERALYLVG